MRSKDGSLEISLSYKDKEREQEILRADSSFTLNEKEPHREKTGNMLIYGDNLMALNTLYHNEKIRGKVSLIYIDPPFSTNQVYKGSKDRNTTVSKRNGDNTMYEDLFQGRDYVEFVRKRLVYLRELLSPQGTIYLHIGLKMGHYLKVIMDEVFGPENYINDISRIKCNPKNFERRASGNIKDMILVYSKTKNYIWNNIREEISLEDLKKRFPKVDKKGRKYTTTPLHAPGETENGSTGKPWRGMEPPKGRHWRCSPEELEKLDEQGLIEWSSTGNPRRIKYADEAKIKGKKKQDIWEYKDPAYPKYPTEKNFNMLKRIVENSSNPGDIVLDCFAGAGTTLLASEETGRRWIGVDSSKYAINIIEERLNEIPGCTSYQVYDLLESKTEVTIP